MNGANVDIIANGQGYGDVASQITAHGRYDIGSKRPFLNKHGIPCVTIFTNKHPGGAKNVKNYETVMANTRGLSINADLTLLPDEWKEIDAEVTAVSRETLAGYQYILDQGLTKPLRNAFGTTVLEWRSISDSQEAGMDMDPVARTQNDRAQYKDNALPIPILHSDFSIHARFLAVSRKNGNGIDLEEIANGVRRINEKKEDMLFGSETFSYGGGTMYTLRNYPNRNTVTLNGDWNASGTTAENILDDVRALKKANRDAYHSGEGTLFIPGDYEEVLGKDYSVSGNSLMTMRQRIMLLGGIKDIVVVDRLADNNVLYVEMNKRTIEIVNGMPMTSLYWETEGGMVAKHKTMEIAVPRFKSDYNGKCGIAHGTL